MVSSIIIYKTNIIHFKWNKEITLKLISIGISACIIAIIAAFYYKDYASVARNHNYLKKILVPNYFINSAVKYTKNKYFTGQISYQFIGIDAKNTHATINGKHNLLILVIGETARSINYQLNGYKKETNKYTIDWNVISFKSVSSCGTSTTISLPCLFSVFPRKEYVEKLAKNSDNLLDILKRANLNVLWLENNTGCKGVCKNIDTIEIDTDNKQFCDDGYCFDKILLGALEKNITALPKKDSVIVLHLIGSHGPAYYKRYPDQHKYFVPDCHTNEIQNCTTEELINAYDNTILYTDYILAQVIKLLKTNDQSLSARESETKFR